ncbi:MAG: D-glycerate dehydrogenase [bacterium]|nr:D-glycerate dehydrogenase [bacterium]MDZ4299742.1 D-glycerate dehydrogenase [Candidatus Sungbacteria bacterium]
MKIFITRAIPSRGLELLQQKGYKVTVNPDDRVLTKDELTTALDAGGYDAVLCLLTDKIDAGVLDAAGKQCKIFANYAVGFDNIDMKAAAERGILISNTPGVLTDSVAEHAFALMLAAAHRIPESDRFTRAGKYHGWEPMLLLGTDMVKKTLGIVGLGRIGSRVAHHAVRGFDMSVIYYDVKRNEDFEKEFNASFHENVDDVFREADFISIHVPLLETTRHLVNAEQLAMMKKTAILVNTSRGPIVDEAALVEALKNKTIRGAALDVFEREPALAPGLADLDNVILTPHTASATEETRQAMSVLAAENIIAALEGREPPNVIR